MDALLLASSSPRRRELLSGLGFAFSILAPDTDESSRDALPPAERVLALAEDKARAAEALSGGAAPRWILAADTLVCLPGAADWSGAAPSDGSGGFLSELVLGKPRGREEARAMIESLAGKTHLVHTGLALLDRLEDRLELERSDSSVRFAPMTDSEIGEYLDSGEWEGVAGAYRVQGLAAKHIERIEGSWSGIVGLPIRELYVILRRVGFDLRP